MKSLTVNLKGYAPDADPTIEGVLTHCERVVPSMRGIRGAPSPVSENVTVLAGTCIGAVAVRKLDDTTRTFAGTVDKLYELSGTSWTDRSRASAYTASNSTPWRFAQFGNVTLASNANDTVQASTASVFADVAGAPAASIIEVVNQFVFAFNTNDGTYGQSQDRWRCCALGDHTVWTPSIATQAATGRLVASPGPITAGKKFGDGIIVYKKNSMYLGTYVGQPFIWSFVQVPGSIGAMSQEAVANVGTEENPMHIFMGEDNFYEFDGSRPQPIGTAELKIKVFTELQQGRYGACKAVHDNLNSRVYFYYPAIDSPFPDRCVVYNYRTKRWGVDDRQIEAAFEYLPPGVIYTDLGNSYSTYDDLPDRAYDQAFLSASSGAPAIFGTSHQLKTLTGASDTSAFITGDIGDDVGFNTLSRIRPRFLTAPTTATLTNYYRLNVGDALTTDTVSSIANGGFDVLRDARWHRFKFNFSGDWEMPGFVVQLEDSGFE